MLVMAIYQAKKENPFTRIIGKTQFSKKQNRSKKITGRFRRYENALECQLLIVIVFYYSSFGIDL